MEGDQHQRRQYPQQGFSRNYSASAQNHSQNVSGPDVYGGGQDPRTTHSALASQSFRQPQMAQAQDTPNHPISTTPTQRQDLGHYYPQYHPQQLQGAANQYAPRYSPDTHSPLQFPPSSQSLTQALPQHSQSPYGSRPRYPPRYDAAAVEVLSSQFGPQDVSQFYSHVDPTNASGPASLAYSMTAADYQQRPSPYQTVDVRNQTVSTIPSDYVATQMDVSGQTEASVPQQQHGEHDILDQRADLEKYQTQLKQTFGAIRDGRLIEACDSLLQISEWLLTNVVELGLTKDDVANNAERTKLWDEFNFCWLGLLQLQKDNIEKNLRGSNSGTTVETLTADKLKQMGDQLISWCDGLEKYGLVDWQRAVWEEEIESILSQCLDLLEGPSQHQVGVSPTTG